MKNKLSTYYIYIFLILFLEILLRNINVFDVDEIIFKLTTRIVLITIILVLLKKFNFKFSSIFKFSILRIFVLVFFGLLFLLKTDFDFDNKSILFYIKCLAVGTYEELFCRVYIFGAFLFLLKNKNDKNRIILSSIYSSIVFSLLHLSNIHKMDFISLMNQMFFAFFIGLLFQYFFILKKDFVFIAITHSLINMFGSYKTSDQLKQIVVDNNAEEVSYIFTIITYLIIILCSLYLIKKMKKNEENDILDLYKFKI